MLLSMRTVLHVVLNVIWVVFAGLWLAILYALAGIVMCILIITIPFGVQAFKLANFALWPFGRTIVKKPGAGTGSLIGNILWVVFVGWWLALGHLLSGIALALTIIGIPLALADWKLIPISLVPFGKEIVPSDSFLF
jgi:uncharacterized membrane protein YccF (DUF307 family)